MVTAHVDCGQPVVLAGGEVLDPDGGRHLCEDYLAWHLPPERRHPSGLDVADGWQPRPASVRPAVPAAA